MGISAESLYEQLGDTYHWEDDYRSLIYHFQTRTSAPSGFRGSGMSDG